MKTNLITRLVFTYEHEIILFEISDKIIIYKDRKWPNGFQFMPKDVNIIRAILMSRNRIRNEMINWINDANSGKNLEEYNNAKNDEDLAYIIKREAELKGCVFRKKQYIRINEQGKEEEVFLDGVQNNEKTD